LLFNNILGRVDQPKNHDEYIHSDGRADRAPEQDQLAFIKADRVVLMFFSLVI
jgi:hypothetical protein